MDELTVLAIAAGDLGVRSMSIDVDIKSYRRIKRALYSQFMDNNQSIFFKIHEYPDQIDVTTCGVLIKIKNNK